MYEIDNSTVILRNELKTNMQFNKASLTALFLSSNLNLHSVSSYFILTSKEKFYQHQLIKRFLSFRAAIVDGKNSSRRNCTVFRLVECSMALMRGNSRREKTSSAVAGAKD